MPIYTGGFVNSRVRETIWLSKARADLESAKRFAVSNTKDGFSGVDQRGGGREGVRAGGGLGRGRAAMQTCARRSASAPTSTS